MSEDLVRYVHGVPVANDRMFLEMVNSAEVVRDHDAVARRQGFFGRLVAAATGTSRRRQAEMFGALTTSQRATQDWLAALFGRQTVTDLALAQAARHIKGLQTELAHVKEQDGRRAADVSELSDLVSRMARIVGERLGEMDVRLTRQEQRLSGQEQAIQLVRWGQRALLHCDRSVFRWEKGITYQGIPWAYQVVLVAMEVFSGPVGLLEAATGDREFRDRVVDHLLADRQGTQGWETGGALSAVLDEACRAVEAPERRRMLAEILGDGLEGSLSRPRGGLTEALRATMALSVEPGAATRRHLGEAGLEHGLRYRYFPSFMTPFEYVRRVVEEQAEGALAGRRAVQDVRGDVDRREVDRD